MSRQAGNQSTGQGTEASLGLFFPVMVVAGNLFIVINILFVFALGWWSLPLIAVEALAGLGATLVYRLRHGKPPEENHP
jgi:hypothetical protein